jgi:hypothetical protein
MPALATRAGVATPLGAGNQAGLRMRGAPHPYATSRTSLTSAVKGDPQSMSSNSASPIVKVRFGNLDTFCQELAERGPNVEPVVRICQQVRTGEHTDHGPLPIEHVVGQVSYLRRAADVLQVTVLHLYVRQRWAYSGPHP